jgi:hypothetical protein
MWRDSSVSPAPVAVLIVEHGWDIGALDLLGPDPLEQLAVREGVGEGRTPPRAGTGGAAPSVVGYCRHSSSSASAPPHVG